jgi:hypothetical protein
MNGEPPPSPNESVHPLPPFVGWSDSDPAPHELSVELLLIERRASTYDHWRITGALVREPGKRPRWHDDHADEAFSADPATLYDYFVEKGGGNGVLWEVGFLRIGSIEDIPAIIAHISETFLQESAAKRPSPPVEQAAAPSSQGEEVDHRSAPEPDDPCQQHAHVQVPFAAADALTWQLAVEFVRRHPQDLWIIRTYPFDGAYDCLSIRRLPDVLASRSIAINRHGTHVQVGDLSGEQEELEQPLMSWGDPYAQPDPARWLRSLEAAARLNPPDDQLPPSTRSSIALRWIACFLRMQLGSRPAWSAWNDWSHIDWGSHPADFDAIPPAAAWLRAKADHEAAAFVWFLGTIGDEGRCPQLAVNVDGMLMWADGRTVDLLVEYRKGGSVTKLVADTAAPLLP